MFTDEEVVDTVVDNKTLKKIAKAGAKFSDFDS